MSNEFEPLLGTSPLPVDAFFSEIRVVRDYPEKYTAEKPRKHDPTFCKAFSDGFMYGTRCPCKGNHWTKIIMVKPSDEVLRVWAETYGKAGAGKIESMTIRFIRKDSPYRVFASYMDGIGTKLIGFMSHDVYEKLIEDAMDTDVE